MVGRRDMGTETEPAGTAAHSVSVLERDPGLGDGLSRVQFEWAARRLRVATVRCPRGELCAWPLADEPESGFQGFLVLTGLLSRTVSLGHLHTSELLGPGDLLRPWRGADEDLLQVRSCWRVHQSAEIALLDRRFHALAAPCPEVSSALHDRDTARATSLATRLVIAQSPRIAR